jgi:hypothetical protein
VLLLFVSVNYLMVGPADVAVGARWMFHGPRGVIHIMRGVVDKAGLNQLFVPY